MLISGCGQSFCTCATVPYQFNSSGYATVSSRASIVKSCSQTTKNKATLAHNNLISVQYALPVHYSENYHLPVMHTVVMNYPFFYASLVAVTIVVQVSIPNCHMWADS